MSTESDLKTEEIPEGRASQPEEKGDASKESATEGAELLRVEIEGDQVVMGEIEPLVNADANAEDKEEEKPRKREVPGLVRDRALSAPIDMGRYHVNSFEIDQINVHPWGISVSLQPATVLPCISLRFDDYERKEDGQNAILSIENEALCREFLAMVAAQIEATLLRNNQT